MRYTAIYPGHSEGFRDFHHYGIGVAVNRQRKTLATLVKQKYRLWGEHRAHTLCAVYFLIRRLPALWWNMLGGSVRSWYIVNGMVLFDIPISAQHTFQSISNGTKSLYFYLLLRGNSLPALSLLSWVFCSGVLPFAFLKVTISAYGYGEPNSLH